MEVARASIIKATEKAIDLYGDRLTEQQRGALRETAATMKTFRLGSWGTPKCGCVVGTAYGRPDWESPLYDVGEDIDLTVGQALGQGDYPPAGDYTVVD